MLLARAVLWREEIINIFTMERRYKMIWVEEPTPLEVLINWKESMTVEQS